MLIIKVDSLSLLRRVKLLQPPLTGGDDILEITPDGAALLNGMPLKVELRKPASEFSDLQLHSLGIPWSLGRPAPTVPYPRLRRLRGLLRRWLDEAICRWIDRDQVSQCSLDRSCSISTTLFEHEKY